MALIQKLRDFFRLGSMGASRSPKWEQFKKQFELTHPKICAVCGRKNKNQLHHKLPFHISPENELNADNVMWLCEGLGTGNHHLWWGHLGNFKSWNVNVTEDTSIWRDKISKRPL